MADSKENIPSFEDLLEPLWRSVKHLGGAGTIREIDRETYEILDLPSSVLKILHDPTRGDTTEIEYRLAWARTYLKKYGVLTNPRRGYWTLTEKGKRLDRLNAKEVITVVNEQMRQRQKSAAASTKPEIVMYGDNKYLENVDLAFSILMEEIRSSLDTLNRDGAKAFESGEYEKAKTLIDRGAQINAFFEKVQGMRAEWRESFIDVNDFRKGGRDAKGKSQRSTLTADDNQQKFIPLRNLREISLRKRRPIYYHLPDGTIISVNSWRDILRESCRFVLRHNHSISIPFPDRVGKKINLLSYDKPAKNVSVFVETYRGKPLYIYQNYDSYNCIANALYILEQAPASVMSYQPAVVLKQSE